MKVLLFFFLCALNALPLFADVAMPPGMSGLATSILEIFTSDFFKVLLAIFLCGAAVAYAFNKDNEKIKRNAIAIGIAAGILMAADAIITAVWTAAAG